MQHLIVPLDSDHVRAVAALAAEVAEVAGLPDLHAPVRPHVTVVAFTGLSRAAARQAIEGALAGVDPFEIRAHGYGVFARSGRFGPSLNVPVVRSGSLDAVHGLAHRVLVEAGAAIAGWTAPETWSPHITLTDRALDSAGVGAAVAVLTERHHPSWHIPVDRLVVVGGWSEAVDGGEAIRLRAPRA